MHDSRSFRRGILKTIPLLTLKAVRGGRPAGSHQPLPPPPYEEGSHFQSRLRRRREWKPGTAGFSAQSFTRGPAPQHSAPGPSRWFFLTSVARITIVYLPPAGETSATVIVLSLRLPVTVTAFPPMPLNLS